MTWHDWWGERQWAAYLEYMDLPAKPLSKRRLAEMEASGEDALFTRQYADLLLEDPLLALRLLKEANQRLPRRLARDITTPLGVVLALGTRVFKEHLESAPEISEDDVGLMACEARAVRAARIATHWGALHFDLDPGELALAALLANAGEVELWAFGPELPEKALDELASGRAARSDQAQRQACGFAFMELTLLLIQNWGLPDLIKQLIRGDEGVRAQLARLAVDTARHLDNGPADPALPHDVVAAAKLTNAGLKNVVDALPGLSEEERLAIVDAAEAVTASPTSA
jgi:HD-like signal output (HDOD) protein